MPKSPDGTVPVAPPTGTSVLLRALQSLVGSGVALFVPATGPAGPVATEATDAAVPGVPLATVARLERRVRAWMAERPEGPGADSGTLAGPGWEMAVTRSRTATGRLHGAVAVARRREGKGGWSPGEIAAVRTFAGLCGAGIDAGAGTPDPAVAGVEVAGPVVAGVEVADPVVAGVAVAGPVVAGVEVAAAAGSQSHLDALVTRIAVELMSVSSETLGESIEWMLQVLGEFFEVDTSYMRRTDFERDMTVLVAEWPRRQNIPDPDPLGEVPFGADPVFDAIRDLKVPFVMRPADAFDSYQERVEQGSGVDQISMAMVPLLRQRTTVGVLGFVKFGDRPWVAAETNALQAVASLMVQLEARIDAEERLQHLAYHDQLTGLPNRRAVLEELERRLALRAGQATALLFLDLDRFKALNDSLGHGAGDRLLGTVAERLSGSTADGDFVARLAGDEFVVLLDRPPGDLEALSVADRLLELITAPVEISAHHVSRTSSIGLAFGDGESMSADELLAHGDAALHVAKARGGNQVVVFDRELRASVRLRSDTELLLRNAIDDGELLLYYQPEVNLNTGELLAVEALVRWNHPQRGVLPAGSFIKVAEETGLIVDLGRWVLGEACSQMATWRQRYGALRFTMRINMSPAQLATRNIVQLVDDALRTNHLPGRLVCFEITEHAVMQDIESALQVLHDLRSLGVSLAIDDFGTGYSSMAQLKRLPVDVLKIDQTFVSGLGVDGGDRAIVDATVRLAQAFGLEAVAEGVETRELVSELLSLGCYRAQGFLLCRPKPARDLVSVLERGGIDPAVFAPLPAVVSSAPVPAFFVSARD